MATKRGIGHNNKNACKGRFQAAQQSTADSSLHIAI